MKSPASLLILLDVIVVIVVLVRSAAGWSMSFQRRHGWNRPCRGVLPRQHHSFHHDARRSSSRRAAAAEMVKMRESRDVEHTDSWTTFTPVYDPTGKGHLRDPALQPPKPKGETTDDDDTPPPTTTTYEDSSAVSKREDRLINSDGMEKFADEVAAQTRSSSSSAGGEGDKRVEPDSSAADAASANVGASAVAAAAAAAPAERLGKKWQDDVVVEHTDKWDTFTPKVQSYQPNTAVPFQTSSAAQTDDDDKDDASAVATPDNAEEATSASSGVKLWNANTALNASPLEEFRSKSSRVDDLAWSKTTSTPAASSEVAPSEEEPVTPQLPNAPLDIQHTTVATEKEEGLVPSGPDAGVPYVNVVVEHTDPWSGFTPTLGTPGTGSTTRLQQQQQQEERTVAAKGSEGTQAEQEEHQDHLVPPEKRPDVAQSRRDKLGVTSTGGGVEHQDHVVPQEKRPDVAKSRRAKLGVSEKDMKQSGEASD